MKTLLKKNLEKLVFVFFTLVFALLLFRNPFSERTLIPNFDPFPDATYYLAPPLNLLKGFGLNMYREGRFLIPGVAPLYSLLMIPFFIIKSDPRMFYFLNVILSFIAFCFYYLIVKKIIFFAHEWLTDASYEGQSPTPSGRRTYNILETSILAFSLLIFVFNFYFYWYAQFAMAENLILPLFLIGIYLLMSEVNVRNIVIAGFIGVSFVTTKYANFPLSLLYPILYILKIIQLHPTKLYKQNRTRLICLFLVSLSLFFAIFFSHDIYFKNSYFINSFRGEAKPVIKQTREVVSQKKNLAKTYSGSWFSIFRMSTQAKNYLSSLTGEPSRILWESTPLIPKYIGIVSCIGLILGLFFVKLRFLNFSLLALLFSQILFLTTYNTFDYRYAYFAIPTLLIGCTESLIIVCKKWKILTIGVFILTCFYFLTNVIRIKSQISLNLRYAETPWYYLAIKKLNSDFPKKTKGNELKPIVISSMLPYYIDFYSNRNYDLLPMDYSQDLIWYRDEVWGKNDYSNLISLYKNKIKEGQEVYLFTYYKGSRFTDDEIKKNFKLKLISNGCLDSCNLYKLETK